MLNKIKKCKGYHEGMGRGKGTQHTVKLPVKYVCLMQCEDGESLGLLCRKNKMQKALFKGIFWMYPKCFKLYIMLMTRGKSEVSVHTTSGDLSF